MQQILITDITDIILARSALSGDITGRGDMLTDNDTAALEALCRAAVPGLLTSVGLAWQPTAGGWTVENTGACGQSLATWLAEGILNKRTAPPYPTPDCHIRPYIY